MSNVPNATPGESEFSHGPGLRPKHLEHVPPALGGMYRGKTPDPNATGQARTL